MVIGGTGLVGGYIVERLLREGQRPIVLTRSHRRTLGVDWSLGDLKKPDSLNFRHLQCCSAQPTRFSSPTRFPGSSTLP